MKILMTADAVGGVWTYALDLARDIAPSGVRVDLAVFGPAPSADQKVDADSIPGLRILETGLPLDWTAVDASEIGRAADELARLARQLRPDILHLNSPILAVDTHFDMPVVGVCHSCVGTWWQAVKGGSLPEDFLWRDRMLARGLAACDLLVAPSQSFANATADWHRVPAPLVVHNGRHWPDQSDDVREPLLFTSGRLWDEGKNIAMLDRAAALCGAQLVAAGPCEGPNGAQISLSHARALGRLSADQVGQWLQRASIYASAARYEPFGLGVLEAAQAGCALVLSDIPTFRELWEGVALFVAPDDAQGFAQAFDSLLSDDIRARQLGELSRQRAARFNLEAMGAGMTSIYERLARRRSLSSVRTRVAA